MKTLFRVLMLGIFLTAFSALTFAQTSPIIIKGGKGGIIARAIEIQSTNTFEITQQFQSQSNKWIETDSDFTLSSVQSVTNGASSLSCSTSSATHPLTFVFKDQNDADIFTITEVAVSSNYSLRISVNKSDSYFQVTEAPKSENDKWSVSVFDTVTPEISEIEVINANNSSVCTLTRTEDSDIYLNF